jgi:peptidoglycan hydrolase CwlO-like protein
MKKGSSLNRGLFNPGRMVMYTIIAVLFGFVSLVTPNYANAQAKPDKKEMAENNLKKAEANLAKVEGKITTADSLIDIGTTMVNEAKSEIKQLESEKKEMEKRIRRKKSHWIKRLKEKTKRRPRKRETN